MLALRPLRSAFVRANVLLMQRVLRGPDSRFEPVIRQRQLSKRLGVHKSAARGWRVIAATSISSGAMTASSASPVSGAQGPIFGREHKLTRLDSPVDRQPPAARHT